MCSNSSLSLSVSLPSLLLLLLLSFSSVSSIHANKLTHSPSDNKNALSSTNHSMPLSEAETLFKIMDSMSSDRTWRVSYSNPCESGSIWPGIECKLGLDNHLHVSRLDFGTHPNPTCKNTATFPSQIFDLPHIESIFFFHCFTHTKTVLSVSRKVLSHSSLQQLSLRSNLALVGPIPPQISLLKSLKVLTLSQNRLTGHIPVEIFSLTSLLHLDLSYNMLTGTIPHQLANLNILEGLDFSYNSLTGPIPDTIGQLGVLRKLDLSSNSLTGPIPDGVEKLELLSFMALSNNNLSGNFPKGLAKLQNLQYFIMDDNPIYVPLPVEFGKLVKLQELRLSNSGYSGTIPPTFSQLVNLSTLSLQNNRLTGEIPAGFGSLSHMYHLNLSRNLLGGVVPFDTSFMRRLGGNLDLSGNPGLCLSPSEARDIKVGVGVGVCGTSNSKKGSLVEKSEGHQPLTLPVLCSSCQCQLLLVAYAIVFFLN